LKVTLLDYTNNPEEKIGAMAAICYDSDTSAGASVRRAKSCKDRGHLATMRFAYATFNVSGISRICSHQIVRMAHAGILQRSQRYVKEVGIKYVTPKGFAELPKALQERCRQLELDTKVLYEDLLREGMKKEDARFYFLQSAETELNLCLNFQGWQDFLRNRTDKAAQWEVRAVAFEVQNKLNEIAPNLFDRI
jgi:thymidylate synthase (FAD)